MKLHTGDTVLIIAGKDKGKTGRILRVFQDTARIVVAGINMRTRFVKKTPQSAGRQVRFEASLASSNAMLLDLTTKQPSRVGYRVTREGRTERFAKRSGEALTSGKALKKGSEGSEVSDVSDENKKKSPVLKSPR